MSRGKIYVRQTQSCQDATSLERRTRHNARRSIQIFLSRCTPLSEGRPNHSARLSTKEVGARLRRTYGIGNIGKVLHGHHVFHVPAARNLDDVSNLITKNEWFAPLLGWFRVVHFGPAISITEPVGDAVVLRQRIIVLDTKFFHHVGLSGTEPVEGGACAPRRLALQVFNQVVAFDQDVALLFHGALDRILEKR